ncbi:MAG TPA: ATP-binding cassette domain-containing protein [Verrucomicrobiales bacterium]|nr:ATP-binding cassette domain-containing protein [Verrucomicrobiales bacterium]
MKVPVLDISDLTVNRRDTKVLRRLTWRVEQGEMWTILGPNGSGKTSLLSCLTGFLTPSSGRVTVLGETYGESDWIGLRRRIGIVSSSLRRMVDEEESALSVIGSGLSGQINYWGKLSRAEQDAARLTARQVRCTAVLERPWAVLSQGERQRVLIGRALISRPALLILDEPCAGLDPVVRQRFLEFVQELALKRRGPALVFVTHHLEEIPPACTHVLALRDGRAIASGPCREVVNDEVLSKVFGAKVRVKREGGQWTMTVDGK